MGRTWTEQERAYVAAHYGKMPTKVIATRLGRTVTAVRMHAKRHGLARHIWTEGEKQYLRDHSKDTVKSIASHLGRTVGATQGQRMRLGVADKYHRWTEQEEEYIRRYYPENLTADVARAIGRTAAATVQHAADMGVRKSAAHMEELGRRQKERKMTYASRAKSSDAHRRLYRLERARILYGLPQKTRIHVSFEAPQKRKYIARMRRRGYILSADRRTLYYTPTTDRSMKAEKSAKKYHMSIIEKPAGI